MSALLLDCCCPLVVTMLVCCYRKALSDDGGLLRDIAAAGLDQQSLPALKEQLQAFLRTSRLGLPNYGRNGSSSSSGVSDIDDILSDSNRDIRLEQIAAVVPADGETEAKVEDDVDVLCPRFMKLREGEDRIDWVQSLDPDTQAQFERYARRGAERKDVSPEQWAAISAKHLKVPETDLEKDREELQGMFEPFYAEDATYEKQLELLKEARVENRLMVHARLGLKYENKEAARRVRDWKKRGVWTTEMPRPTLKLL